MSKNYATGDKVELKHKLESGENYYGVDMKHSLSTGFDLTFIDYIGKYDPMLANNRCIVEDITGCLHIIPEQSIELDIREQDKVYIGEELSKLKSIRSGLKASINMLENSLLVIELKIEGMDE